MEQKQNQLSVDKFIRTFRSNVKTEKSCSPSPPLLLLQTGVEESTPSKLESIDESSSSSTNSTTNPSEKPVCLIQANDLNEMNSVLNLVRNNFPNVNVHLCLNTFNETQTTKNENSIHNNSNRTKFLSPSLKHSERASSIDNSSLNSIERQESKDSGFWSVCKYSFESTKSLSISDSHPASHQTASSPQSNNLSIQQQSKVEENKSNSMNENYLSSPGNKSPYWKKWKKGQAWRYNSSSSNLSTDCSQNCEEGTTRNTSLNYTSFESTNMNQNDAENSKSNLSLTHVGTHFSNSFESNQSTQASLSIQNSHHHLWASTSKLDQLHAQNRLEYSPNILSSLAIDESNNFSKAQKRRGKLVRDRTIDNTDEQQSLNSFNNLTITNNNLTNNNVKLENTRFDSITSLISPLSISNKDSNQATSPTSSSYKPNPFLNSNGRVSPPEKRLSLNNDSIKTIKSTPPSVSSSPAPPNIHDAFVNAVLAAAISKSGSNQSSPINENQYDFYKDLHKLNIKNNDDFSANPQNKSSPSPPIKQTNNFLSTSKLVSRSNSSPSYSSSCSNIPSLQNSIPVQMNLPFASPSVSSIYNPFNLNENQQQYSNSKSLSTCSLPMAAAAAAAAHFMNNQAVSNQLKLSSNESLNFNRFNTRPPAIVITESKIDSELSEYNQNDRPNLVKQNGIYSSFTPLQQLKSINDQDNNLWKTMNNNTNLFLNPNRNANNSNNNNINNISNSNNNENNNNNNNNNNSKQAKPHVCPSCQKRFARSDMLIRHSRLHSGVRPYRCNRCGQEFSRSDHLNTHLRTHTGEKPYSCPHPKCTYAACRKDMITRHLKVHNKNRIAISFDNSGSTLNTDNNMAKANQFQITQTNLINSKVDFNKKSLIHNFPSISFDSTNINFLNHHQQPISNDQQQQQQQQQLTSFKMEESKDIKNFEIFNQLKS